MLTLLGSACIRQIRYHRPVPEVLRASLKTVLCNLLYRPAGMRTGRATSSVEVSVHPNPVLRVHSHPLSCSAAFYAFWDAHKQAAPSAGRLYQQLQQLVTQAGGLVEPNAFGAMLQRSGAQPQPSGVEYGKLVEIRHSGCRAAHGGEVERNAAVQAQWA